MRRWSPLGTLVLSFTLVLAFAFAKAPKSDDKALTGAEVYRLNCQSCHGQEGRGTSTAPSLKGVFQRLTEPKVRQLLAKGRKKMPSFNHLTPSEVDGVLAYLRNPTVGAMRASPLQGHLTPVQLGERLFKSNCASCHATDTVSAKRVRCPASLAGVTKRFSKEQIFNIVKNGVCMMPSFDHFKPSELEALYAYLKTLPAPDGMPMSIGQMCPMVQAAMEGEGWGCCMRRR